MAGREYGKVAHQFWTGETGRQLRARGRDAQLLALYLVTNRHATMIGLYYLPLPLVAHEMGFTALEVNSAFAALKAAGYCQYDHERELVWVCEMARFQIDDTLSPGDKRIPRIATMLSEHASSPLARAFWLRYRGDFHMGDAPLMPHRCPIEGASEVTSTVPDAPSMPESSSSKQEQEQEHAQLARVPSASGVPTDDYLNDPGELPTKRGKAWCAFVSRKGVDVPHDLHDEFLRKMATPDETELRQWYAATEKAWSDRAIGDTCWTFWRARFAEWQGTTVTPLRPKANIAGWADGLVAGGKR